MTFRQIHVWVCACTSVSLHWELNSVAQFQNRRNRTRKEGQEFKRKRRDGVLKLSLDTMIDKMPHSIIPEDRRKPCIEDEDEEYEWQYESDEEGVVSTAPPTQFRSSDDSFCSRDGEKGIRAILMQRTSSIFLQHHTLSLFHTHHTICSSLKVGNHRSPLHNGNDRQPSHLPSNIHLSILWL